MTEATVQEVGSISTKSVTGGILIGADIRLWLPLVAACLVGNSFGLHQVAGIWCAALLSVVFLVVMLRRYGIVSAPGIVMLVTVLYGAAPAYDIYEGLGSSFIDGSVYIQKFLPIFLLYVSALAFGIHHIYARSPAKDSPVVGDASFASDFESYRYRYVVLLGVTIAYCVVSINRYGFTFGEFSRAEIYQGNNLILQILRFGIIYGLMFGMLGLRELAVRDRQSLLRSVAWAGSLILYLYIDLMIFGDRRIFLSVMVAMLVAARLRTVTLLWIGALGAPVIALFWIYSFLRGLPVETWPLVVSQLDWELVLNLANGEFGGWTRIASDVLTAPFHEVQRLTLLDTPLALIPSSIFPDRPLAPALWYVQTFDPVTAELQGGWGFALPLEAYLNSWYFGPVLFGLGIGVIVGCMAIRRGMLEMLAVFIFCFSFRSDLVSLLQQGLLTAAFSIAYRPTRSLRRLM